MFLKILEGCISLRIVTGNYAARPPEYRTKEIFGKLIALTLKALGLIDSWLRGSL